MDRTKDSRLCGNHSLPLLSLPSLPFSPGDDPAAPHLFSALLWQRPVVAGMPKTENLLPRDASCPLTASWDSVTSHNQTPTLGQVKSVRQSPTSAQPENQNAGGTWVSSLSLYFPYAPCPTGHHTNVLRWPKITSHKQLLFNIILYFPLAI